jgi:FlaA1/EpsC-like NDP-sugar epimerase
MVILSGLTVKNHSHPEGDIEIQITGLRPGEKLYEELLIGDNPLPTRHPSIMKARETFLTWEELQPCLHQLEHALDLNDIHSIRQTLQELVLGYQPDGLVVDWYWAENYKKQR